MSIAQKVVSALIEADDPKKWIKANLGDVMPGEEDERSKFRLQVLPCVEHEGNVYQLTDMPPGTEPQFWTVYKRIFNYGEEGQLLPETLEFAVGDFNTPEEAHAYADKLRSLYQQQGRLIEDDEDPNPDE